MSLQDFGHIRTPLQGREKFIFRLFYRYSESCMGDINFGIGLRVPNKQVVTLPPAVYHVIKTVINFTPARFGTQYD